MPVVENSQIDRWVFRELFVADHAVIAEQQFGRPSFGYKASGVFQQALFGHN